MRREADALEQREKVLGQQNIMKSSKQRIEKLLQRQKNELEVVKDKLHLERRCLIVCVSEYSYSRDVELLMGMGMGMGMMQC